MTTLFVSSRLDSSRSLANVGIWVSKRLAESPSYVTSRLNSPLTVSPLAEISLTFAARTWVRKVGLYGTLILSSGGAKTATITQLRTNRASRIVMKRRGLQGIIGGF